jgi:hypothetical protein
MIIRLFLSKRKSTGTVSRACGSELAYLISVAISCKRARKHSLKNKPLNIDIREQQTISQLIISDQLSFDYSNNSTKSKGYLVPELIIIIFKA